MFACSWIILKHKELKKSNSLSSCKVTLEPSYEKRDWFCIITELYLLLMCNISASEAAANATEQAKKLLKAGVRLLI